ncbi:carbohydrate ABC transporter permease [Bowdeniella massiliensis]|uniref:carbohydrate ABC transporter permease n=1 Tax=Bowdeniella massiliensis TaxID=2932264 RepID=UPI002027792F|nr:carbohydrate ABC transporter permease [Bowdeniella massiliensis]
MTFNKSTTVVTTVTGTAPQQGIIGGWRKRRKMARSMNQPPARLKGGRLVRRYIVLTLVLVSLIAPLALPLLAAFKAPGEPVFGQGATLFPQDWSLRAFEQLFADSYVVRSIANSLFVCTLAVLSHICLASVGGYMLSRRGWPGRNLWFIVVTSAMIFPFESIMLSLFNQVAALDLYGTLTGVWLPGMLGPFHLLLMRAAFLSVPDEIEDAAFIDGAGEWRRFFTIFLPQVKGALTVVGLTSFIYAWSDFLWPLLILPDPQKQTMMLWLATFKNSIQGVSYQQVLAGAIVALLPVLVIFLFTQKYFFRGIEDGGLKY